MDDLSSPTQKFDTCETPVDMLLRRLARCDIDLSPGGLTIPFKVRGDVILLIISTSIDL
jgi:hypothetical protein